MSADLRSELRMMRGLGNDLYCQAALGGYAALVFAANRFRACAKS